MLEKQTVVEFTLAIVLMVMFYIAFSTMLAILFTINIDINFTIKVNIFRLILLIHSQPVFLMCSK